MFRALADLVALTHFAFIVFALFGGLLALRWRRLPWVHLPAVLWGAFVEFFGCLCPLTPLENWLRQAGGSAGYTGGFIERYLMPLIYPDALTRELQMIFGSIVLGLNLVVYFIVWRRRHSRTGSQSQG